MFSLQGNPVRLGRIRGTTRELVMSAEDRQTHLWLPGNTGVGKSKILESMICQDIDAWGDTGLGLMLLDPHGSVYRNVLKYVVESGLDRPIIPIDLTRDDWVIGYNMLRQPKMGADASVIVRALVEAIAFVFGEKDTDGTPRFAKIVSSVLMALLKDGRPLLDAYQLVTSQAAMGAFAKRVDEAFARSVFKRLSNLSDQDFNAQIESTENRLRPFSENERFKAIFGHVGPTFDLSDVLDNGAIVLVNLAQSQSRLSEENASLFGTLLLTDLWTAAKNRDKPDDAADIKPFYLYIDEAQNFVTPTIAKNLTEARGYGLNLILANQFPSQFADDGDNGMAMYRAVMAAARSKAVFQMEEPDDLSALAKQLFGGAVDTTRVKRMTTKVVGYKWVETVTQSTASTAQRGGTETSQRGTSTGKSQREMRPDEIEPPPPYDSEQSNENSADSSNWSESESHSETRSQSLIPVMGEEVAEYVSLNEQLAGYEQVLRGQSKRECVVRLASMKVPVGIRTLDVPLAWVDDDDVNKYVVDRLQSLPFAVPFPEAFKRAVEREERFLEGALRQPEGDEPTTARRKIKK